VEIDIVPVSYRVTVRTRPTLGSAQTGRVDVGEGDFGLTVDELLKKAGITWPEGKREGQFITPQTKKQINSSDTLQKIGIKSTPSQAYQCTFKLPPKITAASAVPVRYVPRAAKPHKTGTFEKLKMELRIFVDEGNCLINLRGQSREFKGDTELNIKVSEYDRMTIDELLSKLGRRWPTLEPEGWFQTAEDTIPFNGSDRLVTVGVATDLSRTVVYSLVFPVVEERTKDELAAAKAAVTERVAQAQALKQPNTTPAPSEGARGGIAEGSIGVNVRMFFDNGYYNLQVTGASGDFRSDTDLSLKKEEYLSMSFGDLKRKLRRWPETASTGKFHSQSGNVSFTDQDKLVALGLTASEDGRTTVHQFSWNTL